VDACHDGAIYRCDGGVRSPCGRALAIYVSDGTTRKELRLEDKKENQTSACWHTAPAKTPCWRPIPRWCMLASNTSTRSQDHVAADLLAHSWEDASWSSELPTVLDQEPGDIASAKIAILDAPQRGQCSGGTWLCIISPQTGQTQRIATSLIRSARLTMPTSLP
jgi:hypothetical protein